MSWEPTGCTNASLTPVGVLIRSDSVFLRVLRTTNQRDIILSELTGTADRAEGHFAGMTCEGDIPLDGGGALCLREFGRASLRR